MGRTEKSIKNIVYGLGAQSVTTLLTFISRTVMLHYLGLEVISLNGLFSEVIDALSLAELGIGSAIVYNLYKPLAEEEEEKVCQLMTFFKQAYQWIALAVFLLGALVCIFVPLLVKDIGYSPKDIRLVFMLFVIKISCSYLFSYKFSLLNADQKNYVYSIYSSLTRIVTVTMEVGVILIAKDYIVYLVICIGLTLLSNAVISAKTDAWYPYLRKAALPPEEKRHIFDNVKNIFIKEVSGKITNSTDNILISTMVSTIMVGKYTFYSTILNVFKQFTSHVDTGIRASMGNLFSGGTRAECEAVLYRLTWGYSVFGIICGVCFLSCSQSFIAFWVGEEYLLGLPIVFLLAVNLFLFICSKPIYVAMHVAGLFREGRNVSLLGSLVNLAVSILLAYRLGIFGVFFGTFLTYMIQIILKIYYVYQLRFQCTAKRYYCYMLKLVLLFLALAFISHWLCGMVPAFGAIWDFLIQGLVSAGVSGLVILLCYCRSSEFQYYKALFVRYGKRIKNSAWNGGKHE